MTRPYTDPDWLRDHAIDVLEFYYPACVDEERGGHVAQIDEATGEVYDPDPRHLVATCRFVADFSLGAALDGPDWCGWEAARGFAFLRNRHRDRDRGGYAWLLDGTDVADATRSAYGHAFVLLAHARAGEAGVREAKAGLSGVFDLLDAYFWEDDHGLHRSRLDADWEPIETYRGQNANMHACEALLAAHAFTGKDRYLDRAATVARRLAVDLAGPTDGRIWEHYTSGWDHDFSYNREAPADQFRPWGYQPGHHAEWAKLLAVLDRRTDADWPLERAADLFEYAVGPGWDERRGGLYYTLDREDDPLIEEKYGWPVAEAVGAAAALYERTGESRYLEWYDRLWSYATETPVAPGGNWYAKCTPGGEPLPTAEGPAVEPGYHPVGACWEARRSLSAVEGSGDRG